MNKEPFERLAQLESKKRELELDIATARLDVGLEMNKHKADKVESSFGSFYFVPRKKWTYSENVKKLEELVKVEKKVEEEKGVAQCEITPSLTFRAKEE